MSGFDELGDELASDDANDEWDATWAAYAAGDQPEIDSDNLPLRAILTLPIGQVDVRGDDPGVELCLFKSATDSDGQGPVESEFDEEDDYISALTLTLSADDAGRIDYGVFDYRGDQVVSGSLEDSESASELLDHLAAASVGADGTHVYLNAACVEVDGRGVMIFCSDTQARDSVTKALISAGANYLTDSLVATNPGTHPVGGLRRRRLGADEARSIDLAVIEVVLVIDTEAERITGPDFAAEDLELIPAVVELAAFIHQRSASHPLAAVHLAELLAGASRYRVNPADPDRLGELVAGAPLEARDLVVVSELPSGGNGNGNGDGNGEADSPQRQLIRFNDGALLSGGALGSGDGNSLQILGPEEVDSIESQLIEDHRKKIIPASLGLPGCPIGAPVAELWASANAEDLPPRLPSGVAAELLSRELLSANDTTSERIIANHVAERARSQAVQALLEEVLDATDHLAGRPVVLGELLDSLDGTLPGHFTDVEHLDLLLPAGVSDAFVPALESIGLASEAVTLTTTSLESGRSQILRRDGERPIDVELYLTLASGPFGVLVDPREFHTLAVPIRVGGRWCRALHPAHRFIHACLRLDAAARNDLSLARSVIQNSPRTDSLCNEMLDMAERWGATTTVLSVVAELDRSLPGLPSYLASIAAGRAEPSKRARRIGRRSR